MTIDSRKWIFRTLSDYAESQDLELRDMNGTCIFDDEWRFGFYNCGKVVHPHYSFIWNDIKGSAFALVCRIIDNFEHNCDLYRVPKKGYTFNNVAAVNHTPKIKDVIFNDPATIVFWNDGTKTVVQTRDGDEFDPEKGLAMAIAKKSLGNKYEYYNVFKHWLKKAPRSVNLDVNVSMALNNFAESAAQASSCIAAITEAFSSKKNRRLF